MYYPVPIKTHLVTEEDDIAKVVARYTSAVADPGDLIAVAESVVAITQGRAILPEKVKPRLLARLLCRLPKKDGSLATPPAMELAIREVGVCRILLGVAAAGLGRLVGRRGDFFRVAGRQLALIDDIAGTMPPYDRHVVLGPKDPEAVVASIKQITGIDAMITDVNDMRCVDILACTARLDEEEIKKALLDNPFGNDDQRTPIVVLKKVQLNPAGGPSRHRWAGQ